MDDHKAAGVKLVTVWAAVGVTSWSDVAALLAALYSLLLIAEFFWKKLLRPALEARGVIKRRTRRRDDLNKV